MALGLVPLEAINHASLGNAEREPILYIPLQRDVELGDKLLLFRIRRSLPPMGT